MVVLRVTSTALLLLLLVVKAELLDFDEKSSSDLCYVCVCSVDRATVDCSRRGLTDIPDGDASEVKRLNVSYNEISTFPMKLNRFINLVQLDLSNNALRDLPANALDNLTLLEVLNLSKNNFQTWFDMNPNEVLKPATNLKILDLSRNTLGNMANLANHELFISPSLETLILDQCEIYVVSGRSPISGLINIRVLKLNGNPLTSISSLVSPTLKTLHLSYCQLSSLANDMFTYLPSLVYLKLSHNYRLELSNTDQVLSESLRYLDISYCNILQPTLHAFPNLRKALVNHNRIRSLSSNEFINNSKLEYLDLSYNTIGSIRSNTFRGLSMMKYLDLSWNEIAEVPEDSLLEMSSLTQLKLSRNYLTRVGHLKSTSVTTLDMSSCEINTVGKDSLEGLQSLVDLDLSRNIISHIPDSISSNTLQYLNLNYNRISSVSNYTFFMLPRLSGLGVIGNRFTTIWNRDYFQSNPYLDRLDLSDNMWRCDCVEANMFDFYEFVTLEPNKKEESYNLVCNSPSHYIGQTWLEACYYTWNPTEKAGRPDSVIWFLIVTITGLGICLLVVSIIRKSMNRRLTRIQQERERQVEEARDRLRQLRMRAEQEALISNPDPRDLIAPPSYDEALSMPKLTSSCHSLCEAGTGKSRRRRGRRKTKSSGDLLDETERNGDLPVVDDMEMAESSEDNRRRRRRRKPRKFGSHDIAELEQSPGARRRRMSEYVDPDFADAEDSVTVEVEADMERPGPNRNRRYSTDDNAPRESNL